MNFGICTTAIYVSPTDFESERGLDFVDVEGLREAQAPSIYSIICGVKKMGGSVL